MSAAASTSRAVTLLVNPNAAGGRALALMPRVQARLRDLGLHVEAHATRSLEHAGDLARAAAGDDRVTVAFGGDGLMGAVAGALRDCPGAVLGVLPGGRGNDFARALGLPLRPLDACAVIAHGRSRRIDLADAGGRTFVTIASLGVDSEANRLAAAAAGGRGRIVYLLAALRAVAAWRPARFTVALDDGRTVRFRGWSVAAASGRSYGAGMRLAPDADLADGALDVVLIARMPRLGFLCALPSVFTGAHVRLRSIAVVRAAEVRIEADPPFVLWADGEPVGPAPVTVRALPGALQVLVPR